MGIPADDFTMGWPFYLSRLRKTETPEDQVETTEPEEHGSRDATAAPGTTNGHEHGSEAVPDAGDGPGG